MESMFNILHCIDKFTKLLVKYQHFGINYFASVLKEYLTLTFDHLVLFRKNLIFY